MANLIINLKLTNDDDIDNYGRKCNTECYFCGYDVTVDTYIYTKKLIVRTCILCRTIYNFSNGDMGNVIVCKSELSQIDIIKKTHQYLKKTNKIIFPLDIDLTIKIVRISPIKYAKNKGNYNFVFCFTGEMEAYFKPSINYFMKQSKIPEKTYFDYDSIPVHQIDIDIDTDDDTNKILNTFKSKIKTHIKKSKTHVTFISNMKNY
jgi:hypothetical protein